MTTKPAKEIVAKFDTFLKQYPIADGSGSTPKIPLRSGERLSIVSIQEDGSFNNHYKVKLPSIMNGFLFWYVYKPHVEVEY
ncbi:hypothetical protein [Pseudanabaena sp. PCC 6802]|uniref:hypothetical protein n=1 Tax=Pseudanabaena sp. PCC 6802 TaxID=118173 RepID=UPI00034B5B96|nr:hypothetical protein [Pseudanabaena sp. PCC 6802]